MISGDNVTFRDDWGQLGIYLFNGMSLIKVADTNTTMPEGSGSFLVFSSPMISSGNVAFIGGSPMQEGVYLFNGTSLIRVADTNTAIPSGLGNFTGFAGVDISGANVLFEGFGTGQSGIYLFNGTTLMKVVDTNTPIPDGSGNFSGFVGSPNISGDNVVFQGIGSSIGSTWQMGIYLASPYAYTIYVSEVTSCNGHNSCFSNVGDGIASASARRLSSPRKPILRMLFLILMK